MKFYGRIRASASHKDWELMPAELMSSLGKLQFQIYDLLDSAAEWAYLWLQTWETLSPRSWLQQSGQNPTHPLIQGWKDSKMEHTQKVELLLQQPDGKDGSKRGWQVSNTCREGNTTINKALEPAWIQDFIGTNVLFFSYGEIVAYWLFLPWIESILRFFF